MSADRDAIRARSGRQHVPRAPAAGASPRQSRHPRPGARPTGTRARSPDPRGVAPTDTVCPVWSGRAKPGDPELVGDVGRVRAGVSREKVDEEVVVDGLVAAPLAPPVPLVRARGPTSARFHVRGDDVQVVEVGKSVAAPRPASSTRRGCAAYGSLSSTARSFSDTLARLLFLVSSSRLRRTRPALCSASATVSAAAPSSSVAPPLLGCCGFPQSLGVRHRPFDVNLEIVVERLPRAPPAACGSRTAGGGSSGSFPLLFYGDWQRQVLLQRCRASLQSLELVAQAVQELTPRLDAVLQRPLASL